MSRIEPLVYELWAQCFKIHGDIFDHCLLWRRNDSAIRIHKSTQKHMEKNSILDIHHGFHCQLFIESTCSLIVLEQQDLINPVENDIENEGNWIKNWKTTWVHQAAPKIGEKLRIHIVTWNLRSCVEGCELRLKIFFRVASIILFVGQIVLYLSGTWSITASARKRQNIPCHFAYMWWKDIHS